MIQIQKLRIRYFRSIYDLTLTNLKDVNVLAGCNDVGKSNILKALNLFFNNETEWNTPLNFKHDFSQRRLFYIQTQIKGKQIIEVQVTFKRGDRYTGSLPEQFTVTRKWDRGGHMSEKTDMESQFRRHPDKMRASTLASAQARLTRYLSTVRYMYVPAIKDRQFFAHMLQELQSLIVETQADESEVGEAVSRLNSIIEDNATELHREFKQVSGIDAEVRLPGDFSELFRFSDVLTKSGSEEIPLELRGDGIRLRFIPSLLHDISLKSTNSYYIWGFEEPEISLEHRLATQLPQEMTEQYGRTAQLFMSSHSPAFFGLEESNCSVWRVYSPTDESGTACHPYYPKEDAADTTYSHDLHEDLGLMSLQIEDQRRYEEAIKGRDQAIDEAREVTRQLEQVTQPVLLTEGKWDAKILEVAWEMLHDDDQRPFLILQCDTTGGAPGGGAGGASTLGQVLNTLMPNTPAVTIGLFDRDNEGCRAFNDLGANFQDYDSQGTTKIASNGAAAAILLPVVPGREEYAEWNNLILEFYFEDRYIEEEVDGQGLVLEPYMIQHIIPGLHSIKIGENPTIEPHYRRIVNGKRAFAEKVVPRLPTEAFGNFQPLFGKVQAAIEKLTQMRQQ